MPAAAHRLRHRSDFAAVFRGGRRARRGTLVVHLSLDEVIGPPRAGFVVSRAVGNAVTRNTVRRRLRHLVRQHLPALPPGARLVVRALPAAADAPHRRLAADLAAALTAALPTVPAPPAPSAAPPAPSAPPMPAPTQPPGGSPEVRS